MLRTLRVENYALINRLELELDAHLNIITGETGAGKSILLGALGLLLGAKNDGAALKDNQRNCLVEGTFEIGKLGLEPFFEENDLDYSPETTLSRQITPSGKSRSFINDTPVPLTLLRDLGSRLFDIHSQHQNLILGSESFRTRALDTLARCRSAGDLHGTIRTDGGTAPRTGAPARRGRSGRRDEEWLRYQTEELAAARLKAGEQAELEAELSVLSNADRISEALTALRNALDDDLTGILVQLKTNETSLLHLSESYPFAAETATRLRSVIEELKDISATAAAESERIDADPERLQKISDRIGTIYTLCQKHKAADLRSCSPFRRNTKPVCRPSPTATSRSPRSRRSSPRRNRRPGRAPAKSTRDAKAPLRLSVGRSKRRSRNSACPMRGSASHWRPQRR